MCFGLMVGTPERSYDLSIFRGRDPLVSACNMAVLSDPLKFWVNIVNEILIAYHLSVPPATTAPLCRPDTVVPLS